MASTSGRSSRSTLMFTNSSFMTAATAESSNDSCAITWHQWQAEYPTLSRIGLCSLLARSNASAPHGYQSTGLSACCRRYGLVSSASRFTRPNLGERKSPEKSRESSGCSSLLPHGEAPILLRAQSGSRQAEGGSESGSHPAELEEAKGEDSIR